MFLTHALFLSGMASAGRVWEVLHELGGPAVQLFIIVSGFLIAGVVTARQERWSVFMTRRAFRLYPVYLLGLALGALTMAPMAETMALMAQSHDWAQTPAHYLTTIEESVANAPWRHWLLHLTLLHGAMPDSQLQYSALAINTPAWSLSLEWQFYLLAPFIVRALASPRWRFVAVLAAIAAYYAFQRQVFGGFAMTSHLASASHLFLIGIATQLAIKRLGRPPLVAGLACVGLALVYRDFAGPLLWGAFVVLMLGNAAPMRTIESGARRVFAALFESAAARWMGLRSYGFYLLHWPVLGALLVLAPIERMAQAEIFILLLSAGFVITTLLAHLTHMAIERPGIAWGSRLARAQMAPGAKPRSRVVRAMPRNS